MKHKNKKIKIPSSILDIKKLHRKNLSHDTALAETKNIFTGEFEFRTRETRVPA